MSSSFFFTFPRNVARYDEYLGLIGAEMFAGLHVTQYKKHGLKPSDTTAQTALFKAPVRTAL